MPLSIRGAREHNLAGVDLDLPLDAFVVFVGPSGSGKTSLAIDTVHAEGRRRYLEALAGGGPRGRSLRRPVVDRVDGLPPTLALETGQAAPSRRSTVADLTQIRPLLDVALGRAGTLHCPKCGTAVVTSTHDEIVGAVLALPEGTRLRVEVPIPTSGLADAVKAGFSRVSIDGEVRRLEDVGVVAATAAVRIVVDRIRLGEERRSRVHDAVRLASRAGSGRVFVVTDDGEISFVDRPRCLSCTLDLPALSPRLFRSGEVDPCAACAGLAVTDKGPCAPCEGTGLGAAALAVRWGGQRLTDLLHRSAEDSAWESGPTDGVSAPIRTVLAERMGWLKRLGIGHLPLQRPVHQTSQGEFQRVRLVGLLATPLAGVLYVLDEPAAGLGDAEARGVAAAIRTLVVGGNGVLVVDHHAVVIEAADRVVEFGPGGGPDGGRVVWDGPPDALATAPTATGRWWASGRLLPSLAFRVGEFVAIAVAEGRIEGVVRGGVQLIVGPSGSGKTRRLAALAAAVEGGKTPFERVVWADGAGPRGARSTPASYVGLWAVLRELLAATASAKVRGLGAGAFSLNQPGGRCEACQGTGERRVDLEWLPELWLPCPVCDGRRFAGDIREVRWHGLDASELLELTVTAARAVLSGVPKLDRALRAMADCGLGYVPLGLPTRSLSGGESNRLRVARELARGGIDGTTLVLLDDPTRGLHAVDAAVILALIDRLAESGAAVVVATHDEAVARAIGARSGQPKL